LALFPVASAAYGAEQPTWNPKATRQYLDGRASWWLGWPAAARGRGTSCASCHTTLPYAIALPALERMPGEAQTPDIARRLLDGVRQRVAKWDDLLTSATPGKDGLAPISSGARREPAIDTESVLNAVALVVNEPGRGKLSDETSKALDAMWQRQQPDGRWRWLEFGLRPWENDGDYFGATLAAVAAGTAGERYPGHASADTKKKMTALRGFLKSQLAEKPLLHNVALGLWASNHLPGLFTESEKKQMIADLCKVQGPDGGWSMRDLGKTRTDPASPGWTIVGAYPKDVVSDGYATGLVVLALKRAGVSPRDPQLAKGLAWLSARQAADGTWPVVYVNKERDPNGVVGKFNRDAGAAFALLALSETN
jgi:hypothetical protein